VNNEYIGANTVGEHVREIGEPKRRLIDICGIDFLGKCYVCVGGWSKQIEGLAKEQGQERTTQVLPNFVYILIIIRLYDQVPNRVYRITKGQPFPHQQTAG